MTLTVTIPRYVLDDEDNLIAFYEQLEADSGNKISSIIAKGLKHMIVFV